MKKLVVKSKSARPAALVALLPERMPGEPERFYQRFLAYCLASGMNRSIEALWRAEQSKTTKGKQSGKSEKKQPSAPGSWYAAARDWQWRGRCEVWDRDVATAEAAELLATRKAARTARAALVTQFVEAAGKLLEDATVFAAAPAGVSAAVLRAVEVSRREFGADLTPEEEARLSKLAGGFPGKNLPTPRVEIYYDLGDGTRGDMRGLPPPDVYEPSVHDGDDDDEKSAMAPPEGTVPVAGTDPT